jgi:hypothetical protein
LAPLIATTIWRTIRTIRDGGIATVIVDKTFRDAGRARRPLRDPGQGTQGVRRLARRARAQPGLREQHLGI